MRRPDHVHDLKLLQTFEVAARHLSFTRAAQELSLLQPAVSRQITTLEQALGSPLFLRTKPRLTLTSEGETLYAAVSTSLEHIRATIHEIKHRRKTASLVVDTTIGLVSCYLMSRLGEFYSDHPEIELELISRDQNEFDTRVADIVTVFAEPGNLPGIESCQILPETLVAVCSPNYLPEPQPPFALEQLVEEKLLFLNSTAFRNDWERYLYGTEFSVEPPYRAQRFVSFMVYLQAALNGDGIALTLEALVSERLANKRLRLACERKVVTERGYYACLMERAVEKPAARVFMEWLAGLAT